MGYVVHQDDYIGRPEICVLLNTKPILDFCAIILIGEQLTKRFELTCKLFKIVYLKSYCALPSIVVVME